VEATRRVRACGTTEERTVLGHANANVLREGKAPGSLHS